MLIRITEKGITMLYTIRAFESGLTNPASTTHTDNPEIAIAVRQHCREQGQQVQVDSSPADANGSALEAIARRTLGLETLRERKSDSLDFHDLAVWQIETALKEAYEAGRNAGE